LAQGYEVLDATVETDVWDSVLVGEDLLILADEASGIRFLNKEGVHVAEAVLLGVHLERLHDHRKVLLRVDELGSLQHEVVAAEMPGVVAELGTQRLD
jgi:hypothetical protein